LVEFYRFAKPLEWAELEFMRKGLELDTNPPKPAFSNEV